MQRSWQVHQYGAPRDALKFVDSQEVPVPGDREVIVRVQMASLNFPDLLLCAGTYHHKPGLPFCPGLEAAGTVVRAARGSRFEVGQRVITSPMGYGCFADYVTAKEHEVFVLPDLVSLEIGSCLFMAYQTAWVGLVRRGALKSGDSVLVLGGSGGVGIATIQVARALGAHVIATGTTPEKRQACRDAGADFVLDPADKDFVQHVRDSSCGGVNIVFDVVGGKLAESSYRLMTVEGRHVIAGFASGDIPTFKGNRPLIKNQSLVGFRLQPFRESPGYVNSVHEQLLQLVDSGAIAPIISRTIPFADLPEGLERLGARQNMGKICVDLGSPSIGEMAAERRPC